MGTLVLAPHGVKVVAMVLGWSPMGSDIGGRFVAARRWLAIGYFIYQAVLV